MLVYKIFFIVCLSLVLRTSESRPGVIRDIVDGVFGNGHKDYHEGYEKGLKERQNLVPYYPPPPPYGPQPYYMPPPPQPPYGNYEHQKTVFNEDIMRTSPYSQPQFPNRY
ncbi:hypothetical protein ACFFRR_005935 [Megaselia abdita]